MALAPQTDPGTPDLPWHPNGPGTSGLALAPQTGSGTPRLAQAKTPRLEQVFRLESPDPLRKSVDLFFGTGGVY